MRFRQATANCARQLSTPLRVKHGECGGHFVRVIQLETGETHPPPMFAQNGCRPFFQLKYHCAPISSKDGCKKWAQLYFSFKSAAHQCAHKMGVIQNGCTHPSSSKMGFPIFWQNGCAKPGAPRLSPGTLKHANRYLSTLPTCCVATHCHQESS